MKDREAPLIALSISEPPADDLLARGLSTLHVDDLFLELSRHLLSSGLDLAFGGDLRATGYTEQLRNLARTYPRRGASGDRRLRIYLARSIAERTPTESMVETRAVAEIVEVDGIERFGTPPPDDGVALALELTAMREVMTEQIAARVIVGGKLTGAAGRGPGVLEEAHLAVQSGVPLIVVGGFGGAASLVARAVIGDTADDGAALDEEYHQMLQQLERTVRASRPSEMLRDLRGAPSDVLANGLTDAENRALFETVDVDEVTALVRTSIRRLGLRQRSDDN